MAWQAIVEKSERRECRNVVVENDDWMKVFHYMTYIIDATVTCRTIIDYVVFIVLS